MPVRWRWELALMAAVCSAVGGLLWLVMEAVT